jgi:hypothetical protein
MKWPEAIAATCPAWKSEMLSSISTVCWSDFSGTNTNGWSDIAGNCTRRFIKTPAKTVCHLFCKSASKVKETAKPAAAAD